MFMNIILFIADSLTYKNANKISFKEKCQVKFNNHWTNATWTTPSMAVLLTGNIPTTLNPIYGDKPHQLETKIAIKTKLWNKLHGKYYTILSTPWSIVSELFLPIHNIFGATVIKTNSPYINYNDQLNEYGYYARRFSRRLGINIKDLPKPFFHIFHNTRTHSEYGLSPNEFINTMKMGPEYLEKAQLRQIELLDTELNELYNSAPDDTLIIFTSDHGEDFNIISEKQECGHGVNYTDDILHVPLMLCYKGSRFNKQFEPKTIDYVSCHQDLHEQIRAWIYPLENKDYLPFFWKNRDHVIFTQGSKIGKSSIKFLKDIKVGIKDFENDVLYTQSMVNEKEKTNKPVSYELMDKYRQMVLQESPIQDQKEMEWEEEKIGLKAPHDEF